MFCQIHSFPSLAPWGPSSSVDFKMTNQMRREELSRQSIRLKSQAQYRCRFESPTQQGISPQESTTSRADFLTVSAQPLYTIACINVCAHVKRTKHWPPHHCWETTKHYIHDRNEQRCSCSCCVFPGKATWISFKGQRSTKAKKKSHRCRQWPAGQGSCAWPSAASWSGTQSYLGKSPAHKHGVSNEDDIINSGWYSSKQHTWSE